MTVVAPSPRAEEDDPWAATAELMARVASGDQVALGELYDLTAARVFGLLLRTAGDPVRAETLLHEVYMDVWVRAARFRAHDGSVESWLSDIAHRRSRGAGSDSSETGSPGRR